MDYEETQYGWFVIIVFLLILGFLFLAYMNQWGTNPIPKLPLLIMVVVFAAPLLLFYKLTIRIEARTISILYGMGLVRKRLKPERLINVESLKIPWYSGMGIRITAHGWLYSIQGFRVVKINYQEKGKNKTILIGTPDPEELKKALEHHFDSIAEKNIS